LSGPLSGRRISGPLSIPSSQALPIVSEGHPSGGVSAGIRHSGPLPTDPTSGEMPSRSQRAGQVPPPRPTTLLETDLDASLLQELALKAVANAGGTLSAAAVAAQLRLPLNGVLDEVLTGLRRDGLLEVATGTAESPRAMNMGVGGSALVFRLTDQGRARAREAFERNGYVGPAPVSFTTYCAVLNTQLQARSPVLRAVVRQRLSHLVLADEIIDQVGVSISRGGALFLWGHPGNGKTAIAEAIATMLGGGVFVPYALEVRGHVLPVFDPSVHIPASLEGVDGVGRLDERWVFCQPPLVQAGGELVLNSLDLQFNDRLRLYECPLQLKAAAGVFLIDDFGRQQTRPQELLNRWIVPLERGIDFMTLMNGQKIPVPFAALVVFSTNLRPADLVDEAFLRRVPNKVWVSDPTPEQYREILMRVCRSAGVTFSDTGFMHLLNQHYQHARRSLRACHPRDLVRHVLALARYYGVAPELSPQLLDAAAHMYFLGNEVARESSAQFQMATPYGTALSR
jgi:predicted ATPase with chaperone activity